MPSINTKNNNPQSSLRMRTLSAGCDSILRNVFLDEDDRRSRVDKLALRRHVLNLGDRAAALTSGSSARGRLRARNESKRNERRRGNVRRSMHVERDARLVPVGVAAIRRGALGGGGDIGCQRCHFL
jgi:hypothetical protein